MKMNSAPIATERFRSKTESVHSRTPLRQVLAFTGIFGAAALGALGCTDQETTQNSGTTTASAESCEARNPIPTTKKVEFCYIDGIPDKGNTSADRDKLNQYLQGLSSYYQRVSFGKEELSATMHIVSYGEVWPTTEEAEIDMASSICGQDIDFAATDVFVYYPSLFTGENPARGETKTLKTEQGIFDMGLVRMGLETNFIVPFPQSFSVLRHEVGHAGYNFPHANFLKCSTNYNYGDVGTIADNCYGIEYGNLFDIMGGGPRDALGNIVDGHPNGFFSSYHGWIDETLVQADGTYPLAALETNCGNIPQVLRIPYKEYPLCIEFRKPEGVDTFFSTENILDTFQFKGGIPPKGCLFISVCSESTTNPTANLQGRSGLIDTTPNSINSIYAVGPDDDALDACITGNGWQNKAFGIGLYYTRENTDVVHVTLNIDSDRLANGIDLKAYGLDQGNNPSLFIANESEDEGAIDTPFIFTVTGKRFSDGVTDVIKKTTLNSLSVRRNIGFPYDWQKMSEQYDELEIIADANNDIDEQDKGNNSATVVFYFDVAATIETPKVPEDPLIGFIITNASQTSHPINTPFTIVISGTRKSDGLEETIQEATIDNLPSGQYQVFSYFQADLAAQYSQITFIGDPENNVRELDKANNTATVSLP